MYSLSHYFQRLILIGLMALLSFVAWQPHSAFAKKIKKAKKTRKVKTRAHLYVATTVFPTSASSIKQLKYKAWKHRQKKIRWSKGSTLNLQFMLISKPGYSLKRGILHMVLFRPGVKDRKKYLAAEQLQVTSKTKLYTSAVSLSGRKLKKGKLYELRAIRLIGRRHPYQRIIARTYFRLH